MSELTNHIEQITGIGSGNSNSDFLESAQRFVVSSVPKETLLHAQSVWPTNSTNGDAIDFANGDSIIDVQRNGFSCKEIPFSESVWATDSGSLKMATTWSCKNCSSHKRFCRGGIYILY